MNCGREWQWDEILSEVCQRLIESISRRLATCRYINHAHLVLLCSTVLQLSNSEQIFKLKMLLTK